MTSPDAKNLARCQLGCSSCGSRRELIWCFGEHRFCEDCIRAVGLEPTQRQNRYLQEQIDWPFGTGFLRALTSALAISLMLGFVVALMFIAMNVFFALTQRQPFAKHLLETIQFAPLFFCFAVAFISVVSVPLMLIFNWTMRPNRVDVEGDELVVRSSLRCRRFPVHEIVWCVTTNASDMSGFYWPGQRLIQVTYTSGPKQADSIVCGFTEESFLMWCEFFTLMEAKRHEPMGMLFFARHLFVGALCGSILGVCLGKPFELFLLNPMWIVTWGLLGFLDGALIGIFNAGMKTGFQTKQNWLRQFGKGWQGVAIGAVAGATLGLKCGIIAGWLGVAICSSVNAVFCGCLMNHVWKRLTVTTKDENFAQRDRY